MSGKYRSPLEAYFKDFGYRVVRMKYFIMVLLALLIEVMTVIIFLLNSEDIIELKLFNAGILFGVTNIIVVVLAVSILVLTRIDKSRDKKKIDLLLDFRRNYQQLKSKHTREIDKYTRGFEIAKDDINVKINYAIVLGDLYDSFIKDFSALKIPVFLDTAYKYELEHLLKEKQFYKRFSLLANKDELDNYNIESSIAHRNYLEEIEKLERGFKLAVQ